MPLRRLALRLFPLAAWVLAACGAATTPAAPRAARLQVAIVLPGAPDDRSWSQAGYEGLQLIERELGATVAHTPGVGEADAERVLRGYAAEGFDLVIAHGSQYYPAAEAVARAYPLVKFAVVGNFPGNNTNLGAVSFRNGEVAYLVGVVAALKSRGGQIAYIGGVPNGAQVEALRALEHGARATRPSARVSSAWVGSWDDQAQARALARAAIDGGADVLVQNADWAGHAVLEEAERAGVLAVGWANDQYDLAPRAVVTSAIQQVPALLLQAASLVGRGRWEGKQYRFGVRERALDLAPFRGTLTAEEQAAVQSARDDIVAGRIEPLP